MPPATLQDLLDIEAIKQLKASYVRLMDERRWSAWRELFTPDATFDSPSSLGEPLRLDAFVERVRSNPIVRGSMHLACLPEIAITAPGRATGIWRMVSIHPPVDFADRWEQAIPAGIPYREEYVELFNARFSRTTVVYHGYGYYIDEYARDPAGAWRIASIKQAHLRRDAHPATVLRMVEEDG
jgi:SnoaL-like protein